MWPLIPALSPEATSLGLPSAPSWNHVRTLTRAVAPPYLGPLNSVRPVTLPFCLEALGLVWHLLHDASRWRESKAPHTQHCGVRAPIPPVFSDPHVSPQGRPPGIPAETSRDALGMASGAPQQSSQPAEEIPGFLDAFLCDFPAPLSLESPVPWKLPGTVLSREEVEGELAELAMGFLSSR